MSVYLAASLFGASPMCGEVDTSLSKPILYSQNSRLHFQSLTFTLTLETSLRERMEQRPTSCEATRIMVLSRRQNQWVG